MAFGIPAEDFHGGFGIPHFESRDNYNRPIYDDFDTQRQIDEDEICEWFDQLNEWFSTQLPFYKVYEVQGSDDLIYEPIHREFIPF